MERNSNINQKIKGKFIQNEVLACATNLVDYILQQDDYQNAPFTYDDIENLYIDNSEEIKELEEEREELTEQIEELEENEEQIQIINNRLEEIEEQIEELEQEQEEQQEVYEWWIVTDYLANKLKEHKEPILSNGWNYYWGRCTSGQAILLDNVISDICEELEILDGQERSWTDNI